MPRCTGIAKSTQVRCTKKALDGFDRCHLHVICQGLTKNQKPCGSRAQPEFGYLYCRLDHAVVPTHSTSDRRNNNTNKTMPRCTGIAKSTNPTHSTSESNNNNKDLHRCTGIAKSTNVRCCKRALDGFDRCHLHVICQGLTRDQQPCGSRAKPEFGYMYCRLDHDPTHTRSTDPILFRLGVSSKTAAVLEYRHDKDAYTDATPVLYFEESPIIKDGWELDHVMEIHVVRDAYDRVQKHGIDFAARKQQLLTDLRDDAVNQVENLNFTTRGINRTKSEGVQEFQRDYHADQGRQKVEGLFPYLDEAQGSPHKLTRSESRRIHKEMLESGDKIIASLQDEKDLHGQIIELLHDNFVAMRLH